MILDMDAVFPSASGVNYMKYIFLIMIVLLVGLTAYLLYLVIYKKKKLKYLFYVLYKSGKDEIQLLTRYDRDLSVIPIGKGVYNLKEAKPLYIQTKNGKYPIFLIEKDYLFGIDFDFPDEITMELQKDGKGGKIDEQLNLKLKLMPAKFRPEVVKEMLESKVFKDFASTSLEGKRFDIIAFIFGIGIGFMAYILLQGAGVIK